MGGKRGAKCPKAGCNFFVEAASAKDAMEGLREHMIEEHGEEIPEEMGETISGDIKSKHRSRS